MIQTFFNRLSEDELIESYNLLLRTLKERNIIRTNNLVGDLGEFIAKNVYCNSEHLPNLVLANTNKVAFDAYQANDKTIKYAIKSTSTNMTGIFWGLEHRDSLVKDKKKFDYAIIVKFDTNYQVQNIYQIDWKLFLELKSWHSTTKAWKINITNRFKNKATLIA